MLSNNQSPDINKDPTDSKNESYEEEPDWQILVVEVIDSQYSDLEDMIWVQESYMTIYAFTLE